MQEVFKNGQLGIVQDFDADKLIELLKNEQIDHMRVFEKETGNQVGLSQIEEKDIDNKIAKEVTYQLERRSIMADFQALKQRGK